MGKSRKTGRSSGRFAGYAALIERFGLEVIPNMHSSFIVDGSRHKVASSAGFVEETYPAKYWPGDRVGDHLEFALKYDGTNLAILAKVFEFVPMEELLDFVRSKPIGKYARRLWFLYEMLTGRTLPVDDLTSGNYIHLLEPEEYYTAANPQPVRRQRIYDNLLGDRRFCPTVRRTDVMREFEKADLPGRCQEIISSYPPQLLKRAMGYLYSKETKSSFEIEHIKVGSTRTERFIALLQSAEKEDFCEKSRLIDLQNRIVDPRFRDTDYRFGQNYVGETIGLHRERVHFAGPKPGDLVEMMDGWVDAHKRMENGDVSVVVHAATVVYGFVFLHPFEDGNGRIHRFLIHNILARRQFTPEGVVFPISAAMLNNLAEYDRSLEAFSRPLMELVEYSLDQQGRMTVLNDTALWYRYIDMTPQAEALFRFVEQTVDTELVNELAFLARYDQARAAIQEVVDLPDRKLNFFIQTCLQNKGFLSARKRERFFDFLSDSEVARMELAIRCAYGIGKEEAG